MRVIQDLYACGHPNVTAEHPTTFEITKHTELTKRGDCVIAVQASIGLPEFSTDFRSLCKRDEARIVVQLRAAGIVESIEGRGSRGLTFTHSSEMVGRKSAYVSDRTLMIRANKGACDINRNLIGALKSPSTILRVRIIGEI